MITSIRPADYSDGYGELVRAYRMYLGLSQRTMAEKLGIAERSLSDIEIGRRRCPKGFINSIEKIVDDYDEAVDLVLDKVFCLPTITEGEVEVSDDPRKEWDRAVAGRAAVTSKGAIRPVLVP